MQKNLATHEVYGGGPLTDAGHGFVIAPARPGEERTRHVRKIKRMTGVTEQRSALARNLFWKSWRDLFALSEVATSY